MKRFALFLAVVFGTAIFADSTNSDEAVVVEQETVDSNSMKADAITRDEQQRQEIEKPFAE